MEVELGLPSVTGGGQISQITQEDIDNITKKQPTPLTQKQEKNTTITIIKTNPRSIIRPKIWIRLQKP